MEEFIKIVLQYFIQEGGVFGVLFALSVVWIFYRERLIFKKQGESENKQSKEESPADPISIVSNNINDIKATLTTLKTDVDSIKNTNSNDIKTALINLKNDVDSIKTTHADFKTSINEIKNANKKLSSDLSKLDAIIENVQTLEKTELTNIERLEGIISSMGSKIVDIEKFVHDLWEWHSVRDSDGAFRWYIKKSFEDSIINLKSSIENLDKRCLENNTAIFQELDERLQRVNDDRVSELKKLLEMYNKTVTDLIVALEKIKMILKSREDGE